MICARTGEVAENCSKTIEMDSTFRTLLLMRGNSGLGAAVADEIPVDRSPSNADRYQPAKPTSPSFALAGPPPVRPVPVPPPPHPPVPSSFGPPAPPPPHPPVLPVLVHRRHLRRRRPHDNDDRNARTTVWCRNEDLQNDRAWEKHPENIQLYRYNRGASEVRRTWACSHTVIGVLLCYYVELAFPSSPTIEYSYWLCSVEPSVYI